MFYGANIRRPGAAPILISRTACGALDTPTNTNKSLTATLHVTSEGFSENTAMEEILFFTPGKDQISLVMS